MSIKSRVLSIYLRKKVKLPTLLYLTGFIITVIELFLRYEGQTLCPTQGCRVVESYVSAGQNFLLYAGIIFFGVLFFVSLKDKSFYEKLETYLLSIALAIEGYLLGFQSFVVKEFCIFCLTVLGILILASIFRFLKGKKELTYGFLSFIFVLFITSIVNNSVTEFSQSPYVLIYSKNCPHCKEVIQFCQENSISIEAVEVSEIKGFLKELKINVVPVLYCDEGTEKKFIIGSDNIKQYLFAKKASQTNQQQACPLDAPTKCN